MRNQSWLQKVRNGDEATKKFWLYLLSSVTMTAVVALWSVYINISVTRVGAVTDGTRIALGRSAKAVANASESGTGELLKDVGVRLSRGIALSRVILRDYILGKTNTIEIKLNSDNFILDNLPKTEVNKLP